MKIHFIRHAESEQNARHEFQADSIGLSPLGQKQLESLESTLSGLNIKRIYSSTMPRAEKTAEAVASALKLPIAYSDLLVEVKWPSELDGLPLHDPKSEVVRAKISEMYHLGNWRYSDEETYDEFRARGQKFIDEKIVAGEGTESWAVISHGDCIKMIVALLIFGDTLTPQFFQKFKRQMKLHHGSISTLEYTKDGNLWILTSWNDRSHLT